jgi:predicted 2-oxoglutarate/Fe(II)-dependent dioxygenase YbiX
LINFDRYTEGEGVPKHKDPHQQLGALILASFGDYEGGLLIDSKEKCVMRKSGDVCIMRCRIPGSVRPLHEVTPVTKGVRYSLMITTLIIPKACQTQKEVEWQ